MIEETCKTCKFYSEYSGDCRRYPPRFVDVNAMGYPRCFWPDVKEDDWCGEWKPSEAAISAMTDAPECN